MSKYKMIVYAMEVGSEIEYVAEYPALKGVSGVGKTDIDAINDLKIRAKINLEARVESGLTIPEEDIFYRNDYSGKLSLRLSSRLHEKVAELSVREGVSINHCIVEAVSMYVTGRNFEDAYIKSIEQVATKNEKKSKNKYNLSQDSQPIFPQNSVVSENTVVSTKKR